jgi:site-specific DNA-methyltransferase (adenine-specific)
MDVNKIYNEDCLETFKKLKDNSVNHIFTSPPYNRKRNDKYEFYNDQIEDYYTFITRVIDESIRVSTGYVFFNIMKNYYNKNEVYRLIGEYRESISEIFIWEKTNPLPAPGKSITNAYEFFLVFGDKLKSNNTYTKNILSTSVAKMRKNHKAMMHPKAAKYFIENFTNKGDLIYDPFSGLGTTAIVCKKLNRFYLGSEIIKQYYDESLHLLNDNLELF